MITLNHTALRIIALIQKARDEGRPPTYRRIMRACRITHNAVPYHIRRLQRLGLLRQGGKAEGGPRSALTLTCRLYGLTHDIKGDSP
jgi:hypothetical protein